MCCGQLPGPADADRPPPGAPGVARARRAALELGLEARRAETKLQLVERRPAEHLRARPGEGKPVNDKEFLLALREYIEDVEALIEQKIGKCRTVEELVSSGEMPTVYAEVLRRLSEA